MEKFLEKQSAKVIVRVHGFKSFISSISSSENAIINLLLVLMCSNSVGIDSQIDINHWFVCQWVE
jgi:hypothetical protein